MGYVPHFVSMENIASFLILIERFCQAARIAEATLSSRLFNDGKRIAALRNGSDIGVLRLGRAIGWLSVNWPEAAVWPEGVKRPKPETSEALV